MSFHRITLVSMLAALALLATLQVANALPPRCPVDDPDCVPTPTGCTDGSECDDGNPCNGAEGCSEGRCTRGIPPRCDDRNDCTRDTCDPNQGCVHQPILCPVPTTTSTTFIVRPTTTTTSTTIRRPPPTTTSTTIRRPITTSTTRPPVTTTSSTTSSTSTSSTTSTTRPAPTTTTTSSTTSTTRPRPTTTTSSTTSTTRPAPTTTSSTTTSTRPKPTTTSTTRPKVTTTTTTLPPTTPECREGDAGACDDADPCTIDACIRGTCVQQELIGAPALSCVCDRALPLSCSDTLPRNLRRQLARSCSVARAAGQKDTVRSIRRLAGLAARRFAGVLQVADRLGRRSKLDVTCAAALRTMIEDAPERALTLQQNTR